MGKTYSHLTPELSDWIAQQRVFFIATAPLDPAGSVNCSPKGLDSLRILGPREVAYLDLTGSGIETVAHVKENGRIVLMLCAMTGPPLIVRLHGRGEVVEAGTREFDALAAHFPPHPGARAIVRVQLTRITDSCGFGVPKFEFVEERTTLTDWGKKKGPTAVLEYQAKNNRQSIDGLAGLEIRE